MRRSDHHISNHVSNHGRHDGNRISEGFGCVEVISGARRRRDWSDDEKLAIIAESFSARSSISAVARRHGINKNQLFQWRRLFREGAFGGDSAPLDFVPVVTDFTAPVEAMPEVMPHGTESGAPSPTAIEIVVGAATIRVPPAVDDMTLRRVLAAVIDLR
jgi:transposase